MPRSTAAEARKKVLPVRSTRQYMDTEEEQVGQGQSRTLHARGKARLDPTTVIPVETPVSKDKLEALVFNEDVVTIMVHDSTNPTDEPFPEVWVNGIVQRFMRGQEQNVKRKYVEALARAKRTTYSQVKLPDNAGYKNVPHTALRYPFNVIQDPSPKGRDWLKAVLAQS